MTIDANIQTKARTRREKVSEKEAAIITAARAIFNQRGFGKTTMADIARAAKVADGTLYLYFKNKDALGRAVLQEFYAGLTNTARAGVNQLSTTQERLHFLAVHHMTWVTKERRVMEILPNTDLTMDKYAGSELHRLNKAYAAVFDRVVKDGQAAGAIDPSYTLTLLRDMFYGAIDYSSRTMMIRGHRNFDDIASGLVKLIMIAPQKTGPSGDAIASRLEAVATRLETALDQGSSQ